MEALPFNLAEILALQEEEEEGGRRMEILTTDTTHTQKDMTVTDLDQNTRAEVTPARVSVQPVLLRGMRESRVGPSNSPVARNLASSTGTDQALALHLPPTETESHGTMSRWSAGINPLITGQSRAT